LSPRERDEVWVRSAAKRLEELGVVEVLPDGVRMTDGFIRSGLCLIEEMEERGDHSLIMSGDDEDLATFILGALIRYCRRVQKDEIYELAEFLCRFVKSRQLTDIERWRIAS
jgi:hypothetical protein